MEAQDTQNSQNMQNSQGAPDPMDPRDYRQYRRMRRERFRNCARGNEKHNGLFFGLMLCTVGGLLIARQAGAPIPEYVFTWQMLLIAVGVFSGISNGFRHMFWLVPTAVGVIFLVREYFPNQAIEPYLIPAALIIVGLLIMIRTTRSKNRRTSSRTGMDTGREGETGFTASGGMDGSTITDRETIDESVVFGNVRKVVITKEFRGGEVSAVFASAEINLLQADIQQPARLELNSVFGSIRLVVPAHWQLKLETNAVLGGIEDKRPRHAIYSDKILHIEGNAVFGGIEIESH
jgi:predicted membrane protein